MKYISSFLASVANFSFFTPNTKVHLQRDVMRETDIRLVKYSQKGIFLSLTIFALALWIGDYYSHSPRMALVLAGGVICITLTRAYFLLRFEHIYPQGPNRWRKWFFSLSLLGSVWWGFIVAHITWVSGVYNETPILWLYTVAFFAGSLYVFAPFQRFLSLYMFVSFIPCSIVALLLAEPTSILYGVIMLALYFLLRRQGNIIGDNYWDKLQATYDLLKRANVLEAEKITTESSLNSRDVIFKNMARELTSSMHEISGSLALLKELDLPIESVRLLVLTEQKTQQQLTLLRNVSELKNITQKKVLLDQNVIDLRFYIEKALSTTSISAHKKNIELYSSFSADFPLKVRGDSERIQQLISNLISSACYYCDNGELIVSSSYRDDSDPGMLKVSILNAEPVKSALAESEIDHIFSPHYATDIHIGLSLAIVRGLAECMGGSAGADYKEDGSLVFWVCVKLSTMSIGVVKKQTLISQLVNKRVMLYQPPQKIAGVFSATLSSWGFSVDIINDKEEALIEFNKTASEQLSHAYDLVIVYTRLNNLDAMAFSEELCINNITAKIPQIIILSQLQSKTPLVKQHLLNFPFVNMVYKPIQQTYLRQIIKSVLIDNAVLANNNSDEFLLGKSILLFQQDEIDMTIIQHMLEKIGCVVTQAKTANECLSLVTEKLFDGFISESHLNNIDLEDFIIDIRNISTRNETEIYVMPIIGYTSHQHDDEESHCLASGIDYYLQSPANIDDLRAVLKRFIGRAAYMANIDPRIVT